ncbi:MAG TPA: carbohydrate kinase [bacterium]|nr:carbohydrate kinase [bacterium]
MTGPLFTAIGEILIDFTPIVEDGRTVGFRLHPGGSPFNVAVGLARLGARVEFAAKVSTDFFGRVLLDHLEQERIGTQFLSRSEAPTTLAFVALEHGEPAFSFYQEGAADTLLLPQDLPADIGESHVFHFGSISLLRDPTASTIVGLVDRLRGGPLLSFDPNVRPAQIRDPSAFRAIIDRLLRAADVVKVSAADLRWLTPGRSSQDAARDILGVGPALVVVTVGADGCHAYSRQLTGHLPAPRVEVVDTVGAGDAFSAGLLSRLAERDVFSREALEAAEPETLQDALRFALATATLSCKRSGADPPRRGEVERFLTDGSLSV